MKYLHIAAMVCNAYWLCGFLYALWLYNDVRRHSDSDYGKRMLAVWSADPFKVTFVTVVGWPGLLRKDIELWFVRKRVLRKARKEIQRAVANRKKFDDTLKNSNRG